MLDQWERGEASTATTCVNVQAYIKAKGVSVDPASDAKQVRVAIAMPVVARSGAEALVQVWTYRQPVGTSAYLHLLRKSAGRWSVISRRLLAIS